MNMRHIISLLICCLLALPGRAQTAPATGPTGPWAARDTRGLAVTAPADKIVVLAFLRPDQPQSAKAIDTLTARLKARQDVQVIGIISGEDADRGAGRIAGTGPGKWPWPVVADPDYVASGRFSVRVWPTTVLIDKTGGVVRGGQVAHIAGMPMSFENDLDAYLDFAAGKIDHTVLEKRLTARDVVEDSPDQRAARHVEVAQRLAAKALRDDARAELAKALELKPTDPLVLLSVARTDLEIAQPKDAEDLLAKLIDPALPRGEVNFLKGWAALQQGRWDDARPILEAAAKLNPQPAEAFYLLGVIAQHDNDAAKAADYFRKAFEHTATGKVMTVAP